MEAREQEQSEQVKLIRLNTPGLEAGPQPHLIRTGHLHRREKHQQQGKSTPKALGRHTPTHKERGPMQGTS